MQRRQAGTLLGAALLLPLVRPARALPPPLKRESGAFMVFFAAGAPETTGDSNLRTLREVERWSRRTAASRSPSMRRAIRANPGDSEMGFHVVRAT
jgi:hypothetical protein